MEIIELNREDYLTSAKKIGDFDSLKFSKNALDWWDNYYSWEKFPPLCLVNDDIHLCYLFYNISKDNKYLTIHNILTPKAYRFKGYAYMLLKHLFTDLSNKDIKRFKMCCVSSSLDFYNRLGLEYWGVNNSGQYYCDYKMPKHDISEIPQIVKDSSLDEIDDKTILEIYEKLKNNGTQMEEKRVDIFEECKDKLENRYHFDELCQRVKLIHQLKLNIEK